MLKKLLRAPLPEQIVALLEKLEQNPDASHLVRVDALMDNDNRFEFTWYERRVIRHELNKMRNVLRRARTLEDVMCIVINEPTHDEKQKEDWIKSNHALSRSTGTISGTLSQHAAAQQVQIAHINAHKQAMDMYPTGFLDPRNTFSGNSK
jgi:flagellar basal body L-ring protein FlgH